MKFEIIGGHELTGKIVVSGAKNAALKMIAATILAKGPCVIENVPRITDVERMAEIAENLGATIKWKGNILTVNTTNVKNHTLPVRLTQKLRGSVVFVGPLLARFHKVILPFPGGCAIGDRPLTAHLQAFRDLGIEINEIDSGASHRFEFKITKPLKTSVKLIERSVTATENIILLGAGLQQSIKITNTAAEPEIDDLIKLVNIYGGHIVRKSPTIIQTYPAKDLKGNKYRTMGDRIEAGTWMIAGTLLGQNLAIQGFNPRYLQKPIEFLKNCGASIKIKKDGVVMTKPKIIKGQNLATAVYPGFPTDLQSPFGLLLTQALGEFQINETLFDNRLKYLSELKRMGSVIDLKTSHIAVVKGPSKLKGTTIDSVDLRAGATMILAGLIAEGTTTVNHAETIDRGYEKIENKLSKVGANIKRVK